MEPFELMEVILKLIILLAAARFAGIVAEKLKQPAVLGELLAGVALGPSIYNIISNEPILMFLAELGIILMLFEVGLKSDINHLLKSGARSALVGIIGIIVPLVLGFLYFNSLGMSNTASFLIGTILSATSIGITMSVFYELGKVRSKEGEIILGAAVIDDIIGLIILSIIVSLVETGSVAVTGAAKIALYAVSSFIVTIILGMTFIRPLYKIVDVLRIKRTFLVGEFLFALALAFIANKIGLATILGAFVAGLILEKSKWHEKIEHRVHPLSNIFVPVFFVMAGANLNIWSIFEPGALKLIFMLLAIAVISKLCAGLGAIGTKTNKIAIGLGMIPRGEVSLILAAFGLSSQLISSSVYSAIVIVIMLTALIVPPLLKVFFRAQADQPY